MKLAKKIAAHLVRHQMGTWVVEALHNFDLQRQIDTGYSRSGVYYARRQFTQLLGVAPKDLLLADEDVDVLITVLESRRASRYDVPVERQRRVFPNLRTRVTVGGNVEWVDK